MLVLSTPNRIEEATAMSTTTPRDTRVSNGQTQSMLGKDISLKPVKARPLADGLQLSITTDSVVATATVTPGGPMKKILIAWGDGQTSALNSRPGIPAPVGAFGEQDNPLPAGTYQLSHAYAEPEDKRPFEHYALVQVQDWGGGEEINLVKVVLTPRYRVTNYRTSVRLTGPCDGPGESTSEFDISLFVDGTKTREWHWEPSNNFFGESQFFRLEDSQVSRELTVDDGYVPVSFHFTETDPAADETGVFQPYLQATLQSESVSRKVQASDGFFGNCELIARFDREVSLIVPLPDNGQQAVFAQA
jgi:hypothetical protein